jgi:hypothetical protein
MARATEQKGTSMRWTPRRDTAARDEVGDRRRFLRSWSAKAKILSGITGVVLVGAGAYASTNWVVGLAGNSSGEAASASITNISITAVSSPAPTNTLYPGGNGDVVATISNPNSFPVNITAVDLPTNTTYAAGYSNNTLTTPQSGCSLSTSDVIWNYANGTTGSAHTLTTPLTVGANSSLVVTFTNDATMLAAAPQACASTFFSMPSLAGVAATGGAGTATTSPTTDSWTS